MKKYKTIIALTIEAENEDEAVEKLEMGLQSGIFVDNIMEVEE